MCVFQNFFIFVVFQLNHEVWQELNWLSSAIGSSCQFQLFSLVKNGGASCYCMQVWELFVRDNLKIGLINGVGHYGRN